MIAPHSRCHLYIAGGPGGNSIGPTIHESIAHSLGLDLDCEFLRLTSVDDVMKLYRAPDFAGGLVTMPHKRTIIPLLDSCDELVEILGACNCVHITTNGQLRGTNTDWLGIYNAILAQTPNYVPGKIGMVYGAGGASRAAIYTLWTKLQCSIIYVVNRDDQEVYEVFEDLNRHSEHYKPNIVHVRSVSQATGLCSPDFVVSTVPDFEAVSEGEIEARDILTEFLQRETESKGLVLDMCYHPPMTRNLKTAQKFGWRIIEGFTVVAHQFPVQWKLWTQKEINMDGIFEMTERLVGEREGHGSLNNLVA